MRLAAEPASGSVMPMQNRPSPDAASGSHLSRSAASPRCSMARGGPLKMSWARMALDTSARASSSSTMAASTSPRPAPPHSSPTVIPNRPACSQRVPRGLRELLGLVPVLGAWRQLAFGHLTRELAQRRLVLGLRERVDA